MYALIFILSMITLLNSTIEGDKDKKEIQAAIEHFVKGADKQDTEMISTVLHQEAQQFFVGPQGLVRIPQNDYIQLIDQKKIGGSARKLDIELIDVNGNLASAKAKMWNEDARFENYFSLMKVEESWQIVSIILHMEAG